MNEFTLIAEGHTDDELNQAKEDNLIDELLDFYGRLGHPFTVHDFAAESGRNLKTVRNRFTDLLKDRELASVGRLGRAPVYVPTLLMGDVDIEELRRAWAS